MKGEGSAPRELAKFVVLKLLTVCEQIFYFTIIIKHGGTVYAVDRRQIMLRLLSNVSLPLLNCKLLHPGSSASILPGISGTVSLLEPLYH